MKKAAPPLEPQSVRPSSWRGGTPACTPRLSVGDRKSWLRLCHPVLLQANPLKDPFCSSFSASFVTAQGLSLCCSSLENCCILPFPPGVPP